MEKADCIIDVGPYAGKNGGEIIFNGTYKEILKTNTITSQFLKNIKTIPVPELRRMSKNKLRIEGCTGNNLKNIDVDFPLGLIIGVTGVSGSGKSTLINETLYPILNNHFFNGVKEPLPYKNISGLKHIDKVIEINQSPIGRTPRSNPATYTGVYSDIRSLFCMTQESLIRGYKPGRFSFNVVGGRCETCQGGGLRKIEMNFLPDVYINCDDCQGKRFNRETLEIRYKGKSIADILSMTINESCDFFENFPKILRKLKTLKEVGLGYVTLGQQSTTLSGGEAQRIKLASELSKKDTGNTIYILDEPTTGLHFQDIKVLLEMINKLVKAVALGFVNKLAGLIFGIAKIAFILSILLGIVNKFDNQQKLISPEMNSGSFLYTPLSDFAPWVFPYLNLEDFDIIEDNARQNIV